MAVFDRGWAATAAGISACVVGLAGIGLAHGGPSHVEERGLAMVAMEGTTRIVAVRADGPARVSIDLAGGPPAVVADVAPASDEWVEGEAAGDGRPWAAARIHVHPGRR